MKSAVAKTRGWDQWSHDVVCWNRYSALRRRHRIRHTAGVEVRNGQATCLVHVATGQVGVRDEADAPICDGVGDAGDSAWTRLTSPSGII